MIYDTLSQLSRYRGLSDPLDAAIDFLLKTDLTAITPDGQRHAVCGEDVALLVSAYDTWTADRYIWESHRTYHDIQVLIEGHERIGVSMSDRTPTIREAYDPAKDAAFYQPPTGESELDMRPGVFALFTPDDIHSPNRAVHSKPAPVVKAVLKVRVVGKDGF